MLQGTGSDVGKSLLAAGLCRAYTRRGLRVRPFKPQNMSNNAAVTVEGGEIGRAQALQARACRVPPSVHMNPVLLKPESNVGSQIVVQGRVWGRAKAREYYAYKHRLMTQVIESYERLRAEADLVVVEGAGSAAEVNLRAGDIANMGFATTAGVPVVLVGDIDRGGVIASLVGTHVLLAGCERAHLLGHVVNKFRGDVTLFDSGLDIIERETGLKAYGVVPFFAPAAKLPAEDSVGLAEHGAKADATGAIRVVVPVLSRIANFDDLDPLLAEPDVSVEFVEPGRALPGDADLVILPGSKSTIGDLDHVRAQGWDLDIRAHLRRGGWLLGLCGGYQMLGNSLTDPTGLEGDAATVPGLGLLELDTVLADEKTLREASGVDPVSAAHVHGYEMHLGRTTGAALVNPMLMLEGRPEGAMSADAKVMGTYLHGLFDADDFRSAFLARVKTRAHSGVGYGEQVETTLDALADHLEANIDLDALLGDARRWPVLSRPTATSAPDRALATSSR